MGLQELDVIGGHILYVVVVPQQTIHHAPELAGLDDFFKPLGPILAWEDDLPPKELLKPTLVIAGPEEILPLDISLGLLLFLVLFVLGVLIVILFKLVLKLLVNDRHLFEPHCLEIDGIHI